MLVFAGCKEARHDVMSFLLSAEQTVSIWKGSDFQLCSGSLLDWVSQTPMYMGKAIQAPGAGLWAIASETKPWFHVTTGQNNLLLQLLPLTSSLHVPPLSCTGYVLWSAGCKYCRTLCICTKIILKDLDGVRTSGNDFLKKKKKQIFLSCQVHVGTEHSAPPHLSLPGFTSAHELSKMRAGGKKLPFHNFLCFMNTVFPFGHEWVINWTKAGLWGLVPFFSEWIS